MNTKCADCKLDATLLVYMVNNDLWKQHTKPTEKLLCILCFERRVGRRLVESDFSSARCNKAALFFLHHYHNNTLSRENIQQLVNMQKEAFYL